MSYLDKYTILESFHKNALQNIQMGYLKNEPTQIVVINVLNRDTLVCSEDLEHFLSAFTSLIDYERAVDKCILITRYHEGYPLEKFIASFQPSLEIRLSLSHQLFEILRRYINLPLFVLEKLLDPKHMIIKDNELSHNELLLFDEPLVKPTHFEGLSQQLGRLLSAIIPDASDRHAQSFHTIIDDLLQGTRFEDLHSIIRTYDHVTLRYKPIEKAKHNANDQFEDIWDVFSNPTTAVSTAAAGALASSALSNADQTPGPSSDQVESSAEPISPQLESDSMSFETTDLLSADTDPIPDELPIQSPIETIPLAGESIHDNPLYFDSHETNTIKPDELTPVNYATNNATEITEEDKRLNKGEEHNEPAPVFIPIVPPPMDNTPDLFESDHLDEKAAGVDQLQHTGHDTPSIPDMPNPHQAEIVDIDLGSHDSKKITPMSPVDPFKAIHLQVDDRLKLEEKRKKNMWLILIPIILILLFSAAYVWFNKSNSKSYTAPQAQFTQTKSNSTWNFMNTSISDPSLNIQAYSWLIKKEDVIVLESLEKDITFQFKNPGSYTVELRVMDTNSTWSSPFKVSIGIDDQGSSSTTTTTSADTPENTTAVDSTGTETTSSDIQPTTDASTQSNSTGVVEDNTTARSGTKSYKITLADETAIAEVALTKLNFIGKGTIGVWLKSENEGTINLNFIGKNGSAEVFSVNTETSSFPTKQWFLITTTVDSGQIDTLLIDISGTVKTLWLDDPSIEIIK